MDANLRRHGRNSWRWFLQPIAAAWNVINCKTSIRLNGRKHLEVSVTTGNPCENEMSFFLCVHHTVSSFGLSVLRNGHGKTTTDRYRRGANGWDKDWRDFINTPCILHTFKKHISRLGGVSQHEAGTPATHRWPPQGEGDAEHHVASWKMIILRRFVGASWPIDPR